MNIDFASGNPNAATTFNVRGATSLNGGQALLLVDGVETSDLSLLNPQDIESVSVLKDAASASIYGARAAFGVVLITTKKGKKEQKVQINYNNNFSWSMALAYRMVFLPISGFVHESGKREQWQRTVFQR